MIDVHDAGHGPAVLLLHALPYDARQWRDQIVRLSSDYRVLAPDFPGFGTSPPPAAPLTFDELAGQLLERLRQLEVARAIVVGNSMGGYLAFALYGSAPEIFAGFGIVNSRAGADTEEARRQRETLIHRAEREGLAFLLDELPRSAREMIVDASVAGYVAAQRAIASRPDSTALLPKMRVPAAVIWGMDDRLPADEGRAVAAALPDCVFEPILGAGHVPSLDKPDEVSAALARLAGRVYH